MMDSHNTNESDVSHFSAVKCEAVASVDITTASNCNSCEAVSSSNSIIGSLEHTPSTCNSSKCDRATSVVNGDASHCTAVKCEAVSGAEGGGSSSCDNDMTVPVAMDNDDDADFAAFCRFAFPTPDTRKTANSGCDANTATLEAEPFYFESDHVALKANVDYRRLLRAFISLHSERTAALHDLDRLLETQHSALSDPISFVNQLQAGVVKLPP